MSIGFSHIIYANVAYLTDLNGKRFKQLSVKYVDCVRSLTNRFYSQSSKDILSALELMNLKQVALYFRLVFICKILFNKSPSVFYDQIKRPDQRYATRTKKFKPFYSSIPNKLGQKIYYLLDTFYVE